jgi:hypothetical protein
MKNSLLAYFSPKKSTSKEEIDDAKEIQTKNGSSNSAKKKVSSSSQRDKSENAKSPTVSKYFANVSASNSPTSPIIGGGKKIKGLNAKSEVKDSNDEISSTPKVLSLKKSPSATTPSQKKSTNDKTPTKKAVNRKIDFDDEIMEDATIKEEKMDDNDIKNNLKGSNEPKANVDIVIDDEEDDDKMDIDDNKESKKVKIGTKRKVILFIMRKLPQLYNRLEIVHHHRLHHQRNRIHQHLKK